MRRLLALAMALCLLPLGTTTALGASTVVDCRKGADLQAAIDGANPGDTLRIRGTCVGSFQVIEDLSLVGQGRATLDARGADIALVVGKLGPTLDKFNVNLSRVRITGGARAGIYGGYGLLTVRSVRVFDNGNGIAGEDAFRVAVHDSVIQDNAGTGVQAVIANVDDSIIRRNGGYGIVTTPQGDAFVSDTLIANNGEAGVVSDNIDLRRVRILRNRGGGVQTGLSGEHGGPVVDSVIKNNSRDGNGGGIYCDGQCSVVGSVVSGNRATSDGGGIWIYFPQPQLNPPGPVEIRRTRVTGNTAGGTGGGIFNVGELTLYKVVLRNNSPNDCTGC